MENLFKAMYGVGLAVELDHSAHLHSERCTEASHHDLLLFLEYLKTWPNHCQACQCEGGHSLGGGYNEPSDFEPCEECILKGRCARCGEKTMIEDGDEWCNECGWDPIKPDIAPPMLRECWGDCLGEDWE